jgi:hypothetical protein
MRSNHSASNARLKNFVLRAYSIGEWAAFCHIALQQAVGTRPPHVLEVLRKCIIEQDKRLESLSIKTKLELWYDLYDALWCHFSPGFQSMAAYTPPPPFPPFLPFL